MFKIIYLLTLIRKIDIFLIIFIYSINLKEGGDYINKYRINNDTLAIVPTIDNKSLVYEDNRYYVVDVNPNRIIKQNCKDNGSSLLLRQKKTEILTGDTYKAPILINNNANIIFFPTASPRQKYVSWINLYNIDRTYYDSDLKQTIIKFLNGKKLKFDVSLNIVNNQIFRATRLEHKLLKIRALNN